MNDKLYIPFNLKVEKEWVTGFGKKQFIPAAIIAGVFALVGLILYVITQNIAALVLPIMIGIAAGYFLNQKSGVNISAVEMARNMFAFSKSQKIYYYVYKK